MILDKKNYSLSREDKGNEVVYFEYDILDMYGIKQKRNEEY